MYLTNKKGEQLFMVTKSTSNDIVPFARVMTWKKAVEFVSHFNNDIDDDKHYRKVIQYKHREHYIELTYMQNDKGWGSDYMVKIIVNVVFED